MVALDVLLECSSVDLVSALMRISVVAQPKASAKPGVQRLGSGRVGIHVAAAVSRSRQIIDGHGELNA